MKLTKNSKTNNMKNNIPISNAAKEKHEKELLIKNMNSAFALHKVLRNKSGRIIDYEFVYMNKNFENTLGIKAKDFIGKKVTQVIPNVRKEGWIDLYAKVCDTGKSIKIKKESNNKWFSISAYKPYKDHFVAIFTDITEEKNQINKIKEYTYFLEQTQRISRIGTYKFNLKTGFGKGSKVLNQILGINSSYNTNVKNWTNLIHPDDKAIILDYIQNQVIKKGNRFDKEYRIIRHNDKKIRWIHGYGEIRYDEDNKPSIMIGSIQDITNQVISRETIKKKEEELNSFFKSSQDILAFADLKKHTFTKINPAFTKILGYTFQDIKNTDAFNLIHPDQKEKIQKQITNKLSKKEKYLEFLVCFRCKNKSYKWIDWSVINEYDKGVSYVIGRDKTQDKLIEEKLKESEEKFRRLTENAKDVIYRMSLPDGKYEYVSPACKTIFGYSPKEMISNPLLIKKIIHPDFTEYFKKQWTNLLKGIAPKTYEYKIIDKQGNVKWINQRNVLIKKNGKPIAIEGIATDITQQIKNIETLKDNEEKLRRSQRMAQIGNWKWDIKTGEVTWSKEVYKIFRVNPKTFKPKIDSVMSFSKEWPEDAKRDKELIQRATRSKKLGYYEQKFRRADGTIAYYYSTFKGVYDKKGKLTAIFGTVQDITVRKKSEEILKNFSKNLEEQVRIQTENLKEQYDEIQRANQTISKKNKILKENSEKIQELSKSLEKKVQKRTAALRKANKEINQMLIQRTDFLNQVAHDLKTPLTPIKIILDAISDDKTLPKRYKKSFAILKRNSESLTYLVSDVLDLARIEKKGSDLDWQPENIEQIVKNTKAELTDVLKKNKISFKIIKPKKPIIADVDKNKIKRVLENIISNSIKYVGEKNRFIHVKLSNKQENIIIEIKDNGIGISKENLEKIFEDFFTVAQYQGGKSTGLGLTICRRIIEAHNGTIVAKSKGIGKGTSTIIEIPKKQQPTSSDTKQNL